MAHLLVTGPARFFGNRVSEMLIEQGHSVTGMDYLNNAYDVRMKEFRLRILQALPGFAFQKFGISERCSVEKLPAFDGMRHVVDEYRPEHAWAKEMASP